MEKPQGSGLSKFNIVLAVLGSFYIFFLTYEMSKDIFVRLRGPTVEVQGTVIDQTRAAITVEYNVDHQRYQQRISRGILRFAYSVDQDVFTLIVKRDSPAMAVLNPPIGGWFFWSLDVGVILAYYAICIGWLSRRFCRA